MRVRAGRPPERAVSTSPPTSHPLFQDFARQWLREHTVEWRRSHLRTLESAERYDFPPPTVNIRALKLRRTDVFPFTLDEVGRILAASRPDYLDYLLVRFFTGMRSGEVDGLKWRYVDFSARLILGRESRVLGADDYTKTDGSQRDIQMSLPVYEALRRQEAVSRHCSEYVFCNRAGGAIDNKNFTERVWAPLLRHLGMTVRRPYQMRHTAATL